MAAIKHSKQREAILSELRSRKDHPTAEDLYFTLKAQMPNLSLGTVYRNLNMLASDGVILKISFEGADRYDGNKELHYHFQCLECGRVTDVDMPTFDDINLKAQAYAKGRIDTHELIFSGVCDECLNAK
jgi:Fur family transcriptional regulator, peroxide stress response regulator